MKDQLPKDTEDRPLSGPLYHYTSIETLCKIIESATLHATNIMYMNDASELSYGLDVIRQRAERRSATSDATATEILEQFCRWSQPARFDWNNVFVCCFSEESNVLSQWRAYAPPGRGVAIGFDHTVLIDRATKLGWEWTACRYERSNQELWSDAALDRLIDFAPLKPDGRDIRPGEEYFAYFDSQSAEILKIAAKLKSPHFREEKEWRLISPIHDRIHNIKFRPAQSMLTPYIEFPIKDSDDDLLDIVHLVIGPTPHPKLSFMSIGRLIAGNTRDWRIDYCSIPYRTW